MTDDNIAVRVEALKLVKDWSAGLIVVQSGAIAVIGALLKTVPTGGLLILVILLFTSLIASIYIGAVAVNGTIPYIVQILPTQKNCDIYAQKGGLKSKSGLTHFTLGKLCLLQARIFIVSLILFAVFAIWRS
jgi:hypothetical protein